MPFGWGANPNTLLSSITLGEGETGHQCLSAGGLIQTLVEESEVAVDHRSHQCLSAGGLIQTVFLWG